MKDFMEDAELVLGLQLLRESRARFTAVYLISGSFDTNKKIS